VGRRAISQGKILQGRKIFQKHSNLFRAGENQIVKICVFAGIPEFVMFRVCKPCDLLLKEN